jgi:serine/threonine protein kinase
METPVPNPMIGRVLSHYRILDKIGEGGMGVLYRAIDTHLDRVVALKLLHEDCITRADLRHRLLLEAKAASALNHPNIVTIYDIDRADGIDFIAMEFVEGQPLAQMIPSGGLPIGEALAIA